MNLSSVTNTSDSQESVNEHKEKWWTDDEKLVRTYHFDENDVEDAVICLVKPNTKFKKSYKLKYSTIELGSLSDKESAELNKHLQEIESQGALRWFRQVEEGTDQNKNPITVKTEREINVNMDSPRAQRLVTLAFYILRIDDQELYNKNLSERVDILSNYNSDFLNWITNNILIHFTGIRLEATKKFVDF